MIYIYSKTIFMPFASLQIAICNSDVCPVPVALAKYTVVPDRLPGIVGARIFRDLHLCKPSIMYPVKDDYNNFIDKNTHMVGSWLVFVLVRCKHRGKCNGFNQCTLDRYPKPVNSPIVMAFKVEQE